MPLTQNEHNLVEAIFREKIEPLNEIYRAEDKRKATLEIGEYDFFLRRNIKEFLKVRVDAYIEVFKRTHKSPDQTDFEIIFKENEGIVDGFMKRFSDYVNNPFGKYIPDEVIEACRKTLSFDLTIVARKSMMPLERLVFEGKVPEMNEIPVEIQESLARFQKDNPDQSKTAFIMMRYADTKPHNEIASAIKGVLDKNGIKGFLAKDIEYHADLYPNIRTYMYGCKFGIAVFERIEGDDFNPNVAFELGYMVALGKNVCLLKDKTLNSLHADIIAKLYKNFDTHDIEKTVSQELTKWLKDKEIIT